MIRSISLGWIRSGARFLKTAATLDLHSDSSRMAQELKRFSPGTDAAAGYDRFLQLSERLHRISRNWFFYRPVGGLRDMFNAGNMVQAGTLGDVLAMRMGRSVGGTVRSFIPDARVAQMVDHFTQYVGSAPDASPAVLCGIAHMQTSEGISYPRGGTGEIPRALVDLATELGVELRTGSGVRRITQDAAKSPAWNWNPANSLGCMPWSPTPMRSERIASCSAA